MIVTSLAFGLPSSYEVQYFKVYYAVFRLQKYKKKKAKKLVSSSLGYPIIELVEQARQNLSSRQPIKFQEYQKIMSSIDNKSTHSWGLSASALDDWLENDLKQSNLLTDTQNTNCTFKPNYKKACKFDENNTNTGSIQTPLQSDAEQNKDIVNNASNKPLLQIENGTLILLRNGIKMPIPPHLIPIIKAYTVSRTNNINNNNNNKDVYITPEINTDENLISRPTKIEDVSCGKRLISPPPTSPESVARSLKGRKTDLITKRQRNTDAARRSRLRKALKMETLEKKVDELKTNNDRLRVRVAVLESERDQVADKERRNRQYVLELEAKLAQAHTRLVKQFDNNP